MAQVEKRKERVDKDMKRIKSPEAMLEVYIRQKSHLYPQKSHIYVSVKEAWIFAKEHMWIDKDMKGIKTPEAMLEVNIRKKSHTHPQQSHIYISAKEPYIYIRRRGLYNTLPPKRKGRVVKDMRRIKSPHAKLEVYIRKK